MGYNPGSLNLRVTSPVSLSKRTMRPSSAVAVIFCPVAISRSPRFAFVTGMIFSMVGMWSFKNALNTNLQSSDRRSV